uniref:Uncharacterized protein n=3 Tax=Cucumis melo TaxID=3656 RepID=A0A9I9DHH5_CUCME|nr:hypothetical protein [Cucumis melo subsp. melo]
MALPSNRSSSPSLPSGRTSPTSRSSEISNPIRRSFSGNPFSKQSIVANPRGLNPITPANSPSDYPRRNSMNRENSFTSRDIPEKENGKDQSPKPVRVRSPIVGKSSKHFMSPTISAASKIAVSPRKKVLGDRNEPARSSVSFSGMKSSSLNSVNRSLEAPEALESDSNSQIPPVSNSKVAKTVRFGGFEVISDSFDDSESTYRYDLNPETVVTMAVETGMKSENVQVSKSTNAVAPSESSNSEFEVISVSNNDLDSPPAKSNLTEEVDCVNLDQRISPVSSPTIAPLDADPSLPPYDPKTNYLSPRPQFLHYRPNRRINRYEPDGRLEDKLLSFANVSESESVEETDSEDSSKELDEASSNGSQMEEEEAEEEEEEEEEEDGINVSEQCPTEVQKSWKVSLSRIFKISSLLLILFTACFSIYVVNVHDPSIFKRPSSLTMEDASEIYELAKTNFNVFVQKLEVWNVNSISFISDMVFNFRGALPLIHYENQTEFFNMNEQCLVLSHQTVWGEENTLNVMEAMKDRETDIFEEPIEIEERQEEGEIDIFEELINIEKRQEEEEIGIFEEPVERESEKEEQEQEQQVDLSQEIEAMKMREIGIENSEKESQNEEELGEVSFQGSGVNANEEEKNGEVFEEPLEEINEEALKNSASDELCEEEEYIQEKSEDNFRFSSSDDFKFHDQIKQEAAAATGETEVAKNTEFQYQSPPVSSPAERQPDFEHEIGGRTIDVIRTETGISPDFTQTKAIIISAILLGLSLVTAGLIYGRKSCSKPPPPSSIAEEQEKEQPLMNTSRVEEKDDEEDDMGGEFSISETSSFQYSSMREGETKEDKKMNEVESHSHGRRKMKKNSRRESMASSSLDEYSLSTSASPSYGSFTTYEKIPIKHGDEEIVTPVRRSSRIRKQHNNS